MHTTAPRIDLLGGEGVAHPVVSTHTKLISSYRNACRSTRPCQAYEMSTSYVAGKQGCTHLWGDGQVISWRQRLGTSPHPLRPSERTEKGEGRAISSISGTFSSN